MAPLPFYQSLFASACIRHSHYLNSCHSISLVTCYRLLFVSACITHSCTLMYCCSIALLPFHWFLVCECFSDSFLYSNVLLQHRSTAILSTQLLFAHAWITHSRYLNSCHSITLLACYQLWFANAFATNSCSTSNYVFINKSRMHKKTITSSKPNHVCIKKPKNT